MMRLPAARFIRLIRQTSHFISRFATGLFDYSVLPFSDAKGILVIQSDSKNISTCCRLQLQHWLIVPTSICG